MAERPSDMVEQVGRKRARAVALSGKTCTAGQLREVGDSGQGEKSALALRVLRDARALVASGWSPTAPARGPAFDSDGRWCWSLTGAVLAANQSAFGWEQELARQGIRDAIGVYSLSAWELSPGRTKSDVLHFIDRAIRALGGKPPRRGGWSVSSSQPKEQPWD